MTFPGLIWRSVRHHRKSLAGAWIGMVIASAILTGALVVGDSVRGTLKERALERLAGAHYALFSGDRTFTSTLATNRRDELHESLKNGDSRERVTPIASFQEPCASGLALRATASLANGTARANSIQVYGVGAGFWSFVGASPSTVPKPGEVLLNYVLAGQLGAKAGDEIILRIAKPGLLSGDAVLSPRSKQILALRLVVKGVLPAAQGGELALTSRSAATQNAFVDLTELSARVGIPGRANLLLVGPVQVNSKSAVEFLQGNLAANWTLNDASLRVTNTLSGWELRSPRVFLDEPIRRAALEAAGSNAIPLLTFLANLITHQTNGTPYSMVTAAGPPYTPADLRDDEIVLTDWLAQDLNVREGETVEVVYFLPTSGAQLVEATNRFKIRACVPVTGIYADKTLMPDFPGLEDADSTRDWDAGFPLQHEIRPKDEAWWKEHRGTPKAYVSLKAGQQMWANRFGNLTAIRVNQSGPADQAGFEKALLAALKPADLGLRFAAVRDRALAGAAQSQDFGGLFIGFSLFLVVSALLLISLLFRFNLEERARELGTLLALGYTGRLVQRWLLGEAAVLAITGGLAGGFLGLGYAKAMLHGLATAWRAAVGSAPLEFHFTAGTLLMGFAASSIVAVVAVWLGLRKASRQPPTRLLAGHLDSPPPGVGSVRTSRRWLWLAAAAGLSSLLLVLWALVDSSAGSGAFFGAGSLLLFASLAFLSQKIRGDASPVRAESWTLFDLGRQACSRRPGRSLATIMLLAIGTFLVVSIGVFRLQTGSENAQSAPSSGTGGFQLLGESALPVSQDLRSDRGRDFYGMDPDLMKDARFVPIRVHAGDDASCLNLNRAIQPRLLGVNPDQLSGRFQITAAAKGLRRDEAWGLLKSSGDDIIPAIGDANSITYAMGKKVGDTLDYTDERGRAFKVRIVGALANSILQGSLVIDETAFLERFPGEQGYRMFLIDAPSGNQVALRKELSRVLEDVGAEFTSTARRLEAFNAVQNTYLGTFQLLGGLGLLLGSAGLGVVVLRNVLERRGELAAMMAVGFTRRRLHSLVLGEHVYLLVLGLAAGLLAATVAVLPPALTQAVPVPWSSLALTLAGIVINGLAWSWLAASHALRGNLLEALREE